MPEVKEIEKIEVGSIRLSESLFKEITEIIDEIHLEFQKEKTGKPDLKYQSVMLKYVIQTKKNDIETKDSISFLKRLSPQNYKGVRIWIYFGEKQISIDFRTYTGSPAISVEGTDPTWVHGISKRLEDLFNKYKTKNEFFHSKKGWMLYLGIPLIFGIALNFVTQSHPESLTDLGNLSTLHFLEKLFEVATSYGIGWIGTFWAWAGLFHWMFPKIEIENSRPVKFRKFIVTTIGIIIVTIIAEGIFSLFSHK